jgi:hypothetical protein
MSGNIKPTENNTLLVAGLGIIATLLVFAVLTNRPIPFINSQRAALIVLVVIGISMCAVGGVGPAIAKYGFSSPLFIIGAVFGVLMLLIPGAVLVGVKLPLIPTEHEAIIALTILGIIKILINLAAGIFLKT